MSESIVVIRVHSSTLCTSVYCYCEHIVKHLKGKEFVYHFQPARIVHSELFGIIENSCISSRITAKANVELGNEIKSKTDSER